MSRSAINRRMLDEQRVRDFYILNCKFRYSYNSANNIRMDQAAFKKMLQQKINEEILSNKKKVRYSLTRKQRNVVGSKDVLLVFVPQDNNLLYLKQGINLPFVDEANITKNINKDVADISRSVVNNPSKSVQLIIQYPKKNSKGGDDILEWKFDMHTKQVAAEWFTMLKLHKEELLKPKPQPQNSVFGSNISKNNPELNNKPSGEIDPMQFLLTESKVVFQQPQKKPDVNPERENANMGSSIKPQPSPSVNPPSRIESNALSPSVIPHTNQPTKSLQESRLESAYGATSKLIGLNQSRVKPQNQSVVSNDWNFKFVKSPSRETVYQFERAAYAAFDKVFKSRDTSVQNSLIRQNVQGLSVQIADIGSPQAKYLKNQYRNYHYIIECCKLEFDINVPLACLIQHYGCVCLVKAQLPKQAVLLRNKREVEPVISNLQTKTRIANNTFNRGQCNFYDLTKQYGSYGEQSRIYVDNLDLYLPEVNLNKKDKDEQNTFYIRPQLMQYFANKVIPGGNLENQKQNKALSDVTNALDAEIRDVTECLSREEIYVTNIYDLKQFLHYRGVNMKLLNNIYQGTKNKFVKKYLQTCLVAKLIKDEINFSVNSITKNGKQTRCEQCVEDQLRLFIQGKTATANEYWKKLTLEFRRLHGTTISSHELVGGFLLSCLMTLIPGEYDISMIDKSKTIFKDQGIIKKGFVKKLKPKIKSYFRFSSKIVQTIEVCKYSQKNQEVFKKLVAYMNLQSKNVDQSYNVNNSRPYILGYLSDFVPPEVVDSKTLPCSRQIYSMVNYEPPNAPSLKITLNFIKQYVLAIKRQKLQPSEQFESVIRGAVDNINYWLEFQHPKVCQFYQKISSYEEACGNTEESLQILEKAIQISYRTQAKNTRTIGLRHYAAGGQYLKAGKKKEAIENLQKAKSYLEKSEGDQKQYALVLLKLASLQLNSGDTDTCVRYCKDALKSAQKGEMPDVHAIKIYEILCRAYQIKGEKEELRKLGSICSRQFNRTRQQSAFNQMIKICLTGTLARLSIDRSKSLLDLCLKIKQTSGLKPQHQAISAMQQKSKSSIVMQAIMAKSDNCERYLNEYLSNKYTNEGREYIDVLGLVAGAVGIDFIEGLHEQKQFQ